MTKVYELPKGRRITADFDENGIAKVTIPALDSLIRDLNYYADNVCDIEQIRDEINDIEEGISSYYNDRPWLFKDEVLEIIDKYKGDKE